MVACLHVRPMSVCCRWCCRCGVSLILRCRVGCSPFARTSCWYTHMHTCTHTLAPAPASRQSVGSTSTSTSSQQSAVSRQHQQPAASSQQSAPAPAQHQHQHNTVPGNVDQLASVVLLGEVRQPARYHHQRLVLVVRPPHHVFAEGTDFNHLF